VDLDEMQRLLGECPSVAPLVALLQKDPRTITDVGPLADGIDDLDMLINYHAWRGNTHAALYLAVVADRARRNSQQHLRTLSLGAAHGQHATCLALVKLPGCLAGPDASDLLLRAALRDGAVSVVAQYWARLLASFDDGRLAALVAWARRMEFLGLEPTVPVVLLADQLVRRLGVYAAHFRSQPTWRGHKRLLSVAMRHFAWSICTTSRLAMALPGDLSNHIMALSWVV
jgi:hypothetical protein